MNIDESTPSGQEPAFDWRRYLHAVLRRWWLILLSVMVVTVATGLYTSRQPSLYRSEVSLIIDPRTPQVLTGVQDVYDVGAGNALSFRTEHEVLKSRLVARNAALAMGLQLTQDGQTAGSEPGAARSDVAPSDPADIVVGRYTVEPDRMSNVVRISVVDKDPAFCAGLANAIAEAYLDLNLDKRVDSTRDASKWLTQQHDELRQQLRESEDGLLKFMADNSILNASIQSQLDEVTQRLSAFNGQLATEEAGRIRDVLNVQALEKVKDNPALIDTLPEIQNAGVINELKTRLIEVRAMEMELSARYLADHPKMKLVAEQQATLKADLEREVSALLTSMERAKDSRQASIDGLKAALAEERGKEARLNKLLIEYERMKRDRDTDAKLFDMVTSRIKETGLTGSQPFNNVRVLDRALVPKRPFQPNLQQALLAALVAGLLLGVSLAALLELVDSTIKSQGDIEALVDVPFLGLLPLIAVDGADPRGANGRGRASELKAMRERDLFVLKNPRSAVAECARFIRTNLLFMSPDRPLKTLVVTSPSPQEGKTTTAVTIAISMAQTGNRTLIVDTDLRKPRLHRVFGVDGEAGISNVLLGDVSLDGTLQKTEVPNLDVLVCGSIPPNPSEILLSDRFGDIVKELSRRYDRVIFDTPPIGPVTDPAILGTLVDGVVVVVNCEKTSKESLKQAVRSLRGANVRIFGAILNDVDVSSKRYSGAYYAYYRRYGGYYGDGEPTDPRAQAAE